MPRIHGFEARSGKLARRSAHDLPNDRIGLRYGNAAGSSRLTGKPEVLLEWCQQAESLIEPSRATDHFRVAPLPIASPFCAAIGSVSQCEVLNSPPLFFLFREEECNLGIF